MSTSVLYRVIGLAGYRHLSVCDEQGGFKLSAEPPASAIRCPGCDSSQIIRRGTVDRRVVVPRVGLRKAVVFIRTPRVECRRCRTVRAIHLPSVVPRKNHTKGFVRMVVDLRKMMTIQDIAMYLGVSSTMIRGIDKQYLKGRYARPRLKDVKVIAIDEISIRKGHTYATIVLDLKSGAIIFVGKGKGEIALKPFWKRLRSSGAKIEAMPPSQLKH